MRPIQLRPTRSLFVRHVLAVSSSVLLPTPPAFGANLDVAFALTPVLQLREAVTNLDAELFSGLLQSAQGVAAADGDATRSSIRKLLNNAQGRPREVGNALADAGRRARLLSKAAANELEGHAREAEERLAAILEYDQTNSFKTDALGNREPLMRPDELSFIHRALISARQELDEVFACLPAEERAQATALYAHKSLLQEYALSGWWREALTRVRRVVREHTDM